MVERTYGTSGKSLRVLTWHIHGSYLYYLSRLPITLYLPVRKGNRPGYSGKSGAFPWKNNVIEVDASEVRRLDLDAVIMQSPDNYRQDRYDILSPTQLRLPMVYLEHDPPRVHPSDTQHITYGDTDVNVVHVTHYNRLMWDNGNTRTAVIPHGVTMPAGVSYDGSLPRGITVINNLKLRGRRLGADIFADTRKRFPLDLAGMDAVSMGGIGEIPFNRLPDFLVRYRFFYYPVRYTSFGLALAEAMMLGLPVVALATTETASVIENGVSGFVSTNVRELETGMRILLDNPDIARRMGVNAARRANALFSIRRFSDDWLSLLGHIVSGRRTDLRPSYGPQAEGGMA